MNLSSIAAALFALIFGFGISLAALNQEQLISWLNNSNLDTGISSQSKAGAVASDAKTSSVSNEVSSLEADPADQKKTDSKKESAFAKMEAFVKKNPKDRMRAIAYGAFLVKKGELERAKLFYREYLENRPHDSDALYGLGWASEKSREWDVAVQSYELAIKRDRKSAVCRNNLAWVLATAPDDSIRDGNRAIKLSNEAIRIAGYSSSFLLDTLAAAYAESGDFESAIEAQLKAVKQAPASKKNELRSRLELYRIGKPYRELETQE